VPDALPSNCGPPRQKKSIEEPLSSPFLLRLLLYPKNAVLSCLGDSEFDHGLGWNLDLLLGLGIEARARFPLLLYELAEAWQDEFTVLFDLFVCERAERIEKYSSGFFVGLRRCRQCDLKLGLGHVSRCLWRRTGIISRESGYGGFLLDATEPTHIYRNLSGDLGGAGPETPFSLR
jgi:hypothetical protein